MLDENHSNGESTSALKRQIAMGLEEHPQQEPDEKVDLEEFMVDEENRPSEDDQ